MQLIDIGLTFIGKPLGGNLIEGLVVMAKHVEMAGFPALKHPEIKLGSLFSDGDFILRIV